MTRILLLLFAACSESSAPAATPAAVVKCSAEQGVRCDCDSRDSPSGTEITCSRASLGDSSVCCSDEGFAKDKNGGCSCVALGCERAGATCRCGPVTTANAERVATCADDADAGRACCVDPTKRRCVCSAEPCDGTVVPDCSLERIEKTCAAQFTTYRTVVESCRD
jgi:hypothetical protein